MNVTLKYVLRKLKASRTFSLINILGLGISLTVAVVVFLYVDYETSFDKYNEDAKDIYFAMEGQDFSSVFPVPFSAVLKNDIPAIEEAASILPWEIQKKLKTTKGEFAETCLYLEESVFSIFNIDVLFQNNNEIFPEVNSLAISESLAIKLYGSANLAIGKLVTVEKDKVEIISTVFRDIPPNSSIQFDVAAPLQTAIKNFNIDVSWNSSYVRTFVKLNNPVEEINPSLSRLMKEHEFKFSLFPITNLHLAQNDGSQKATIRIAVLASFFVILLACINFINLSTADILKRTKEVGINKILGATRRSIFKNFVVETLILSTVSIVLAFVISILLLPYINKLIGTSLSLEQFDISKLGLLLAIVSSTSVITALIPYWFYVKTKPIQLFNKELERNQFTVFFRKGLLVAQLSLTIIIVIATLFISKQVKYIGNTNLGFNKEQMVFLESSEIRGFTQKAELFKEELQQSPFITSVSTVDCKPGLIGSSTTGFNWSGKNPDSNTSCYLYRVGDGFVNTFGLKLLDGAEFSSNQSNKGKVLINETFARLIAEDESIVNKTIFYGKRPFQVVGIVNDFTFNSIKEKQQPSAIFHDPSRGFYPCIRYAHSQNVSAVLTHINKTMSQVYPDLDYKITFTNDFILNEFMASEIRLSRFFSLFSVLGLVICCIGLLGLTLFESQKRTKEIGIRKVNGAKVSEILGLLNKDFIKWVAIAFVVACPIAYFAMNKWLENFAYKTTLSWWVFALAGVLALGIALLTVSWQSWRAATRNPVEALRYE